MQNKRDLTRTHILWTTLAWIGGLALILIIWTILSATVYKENHELPNVGSCFTAFGNLLAQGDSWKAIAVAWAQTLACFVGSLILAIGFALLSRYSKFVSYIMMPFVTLARAFPTQVLMILIAVFLINIMPLVPITVAFFIIFPMMYEGINNAINNVNHKNIEMANVFHVSKWEQFKFVYVPATLPYIFSAMIAAFGLTFKITIASQFLQSITGAVPPTYPSIGEMLAKAIGDGKFDIIIAWGMIAILISLIMELIIKEISRICMPNKYRDLQIIKNLFKKNRVEHVKV